MSGLGFALADHALGCGFARASLRRPVILPSASLPEWRASCYVIVEMFTRWLRQASHSAAALPVPLFGTTAEFLLGAMALAPCIDCLFRGAAALDDEWPLEVRRPLVAVFQ